MPRRADTPVKRLTEYNGLTDAELIDLIDEVECEPGGDPSWEFTLLDEESTPDTITIELTHWTFESRSWEFSVEHVPEGTTRSAQSTTVSFKRPTTVRGFVRDLAETAVMTAAHETLEFFRFRGSLFHDPHEDGDPEVRLP